MATAAAYVARPAHRFQHDAADRISAPEVAARLAGRMAELARELVGADPTGRHGDEWRFRSRGSLAVVVRGPERGSWFDHEAGQGGDALALAAHLHRTTMGAAYRWALDWLGLAEGVHTVKAPARSEPAPERRPAPAATAPMARTLWAEAMAPAGTAVERYLASRGLTLPGDAPIRFHPSCARGGERLPAMVALMTDPATGAPCGVHRTFLAPDGGGKAEGQAKMMLGAAGVVRLVPDEAVELGLGLAEGIETALALMQRFGWSPVWAAASAGGIARFPVLPGLEVLTIFADADDGGASVKAGNRCAGAWSDAGREARVLTAPPGQDFDDASRRAA